MTVKLLAGELDQAMRIVEDEGYHDLSNNQKMIVAAELLKASALRDIASRLRHLEQTIHESNE